MPRIKGIITELSNKGDCYLRAKPSSPWIGVSTGIQSFKVESGNVNFFLDPTPDDRVWLVDYATEENSTERFIPRESWCVPVEDCDISEIRNFSPAKVKELKDSLAYLKEGLANPLLEIISKEVGELVSSLKEELAKETKTLTLSLKEELAKELAKEGLFPTEDSPVSANTNTSISILERYAS